MPRELGPSIPESEFLLQALRAGVRLDGRDKFQQRELKLSFGSELGWVECCLGLTRVVVQVSAEIVSPLPDRPYEGFLVLSTEISPMASSSYEPTRASEQEIILSRLLEKAVRRSGCVDREALCIIAGSKVWSIRVDVHCLDDEGNLLDAASIAVVTALKHFRKPDVTVIGEDMTIHSLTERVPVPLAIHHTPICLTFAFFGDESLVVYDPSHLESSFSTGLLTLTLNAQSEICVLSKMGGKPLDVEELLGVIVLGMKRVKEIDQKIKDLLEKEAKKKVVEVR